MTATFPYLIELVEDSTTGLADIAKRRMFGCDAFFVGDHIFVLLWKTGRIGVKLTDPAAHARLLAIDGAEPWQIGEKTMSHWVLTPEDLHDDPAALTPWIRQAYALARSGAPASKKTAKPADKTAAKPADRSSAKPAAKAAARGKSRAS